MKEDREYYESKDNDSDYLNFEFSLIPYEELNRQGPPFFPNPNTPFFPGNTPPPRPPSGPGGPGGFDPPGGPGGSGMPSSGPPNFIPSKADKGVQNLSGQTGPGASPLVSPGSISFCLFRFTYIWERSGRAYWAYLIRVDRRSVSGFRWLGRSWAFFGVDLRRIDSFICYRSDNSRDYENPAFTRSADVEYESIKQEFSLSDVREIYSKTLAYIDIPEAKDDYLVETIGVVEGNDVQSKIPCKKSRITSYRIILEVSYPADFNESIKESINRTVDECSEVAIDALNTFRDADKYLNPLELFNKSLKSIPTALKAFSAKFTRCLQNIPGYREISNNITYTIRREKNSDRWRVL